MALPKVNRLKHQYDFSAVYQKGIRRRAGYLTLRALRRMRSRSRQGVEESSGSCNVRREMPTRVGISISQKVSKRAVVRNRIKRQLKAGLRQLLPRVSPGWDLVVVVHPQAVQCDYLQFLQELEQLLIQAEVLNGRT